MNPLVSIARFLALGIHKSKVPTGFTPLSKVRVATVMLDAEGKDAQSLVDSVNKYFSGKGIRAEIFALSREKKPAALKGAYMLGRRNVNWFGKPRKNKRTPRVDLGEQLFINLLPSDNFTSQFCAAASQAVFKIGCASSSKGIYDIFVDSEGHAPSDIFAQMAGLLDTVK